MGMRVNGDEFIEENYNRGCSKACEVSKSTVSQFLNKRYEYMSELTRERIELAIEELDYRPNIVARSLTQKSTFTVGVIVANILHSFSTHIIRAIENKFYEKGFHIIVCNADDEPDKEKEYIEMLMAKQVDGIIIFPTGGNVDLYKRMKKSGFPLVFMDRTIADLGIETVLLDNDKACGIGCQPICWKRLQPRLPLSLRQSLEISVLGLNVFKDIKMR